MYDCIVTATNLEHGIYKEMRGMHYGAIGLAFDENMEDGDFADDLVFRARSTWACNKADVDRIVEKLSAQWPGYEIKVFNLSAISVRGIGELKSKHITEDGVLPA